MDAHRIDALAKLLGQRRTRRSALLGGGAGAVAFAAAVRGPGAAQPATATPATAPADDPEDIELLFVQAFAAGALAPRPESPDLFTLTLSGGGDSTFYFSSRPNRLVGTMSTQRLLDELGFTPANPPNAALVVQRAEGEDTIIGVELLNPILDPTSQTLTYDVRLLPVDDAGPDLIASTLGPLGSTLLFIDSLESDVTLSCSPVTFTCQAPDGSSLGDIGKQSMCYHASTISCRACDPDKYNALCNQTYSACNGACTAIHGRGGLNWCDPQTVFCVCDGTASCRGISFERALVKVDFCSHDPCCAPCDDPSFKTYKERCNATFAECNGHCRAVRGFGTGC
jgi:hypothetical protein